jgi:NitT/TauT family transport system ATP-binding protein
MTESALSPSIQSTTAPRAESVLVTGKDAGGHSGVAIRLRGVGRNFDSPTGLVQAVQDVDLDVRPREFCVIVGPSGCGKTTLLRMLSGLEQPTTGSIELIAADGHEPTNAMVFQGRSVFPWLTVRQNIAYGLKLAGVKRHVRGTTADRLVTTVGLSQFSAAYPHQLSEGMRQRVAIARALAVDPDLLLMDEPFGALDEQTRLILQEELLRIWENTGKTVVFVTHSIDEALTLADRVVVMGAHPGTIKSVLQVPFPRPRSLTAIRSDPAFAGLFAEIWAILRGEVAMTREEPLEPVR